MSLGDPAFGPSYTRACDERAQLAAMLLELVELNERRARMCCTPWDSRGPHGDDCPIRRSQELLERLELPPVSRDPKRVRLVVEVDMTDDGDWNVGIVPGSGDELPPNKTLSTILTYVARQHTEHFTNDPDIDQED